RMVTGSNLCQHYALRSAICNGWAGQNVIQPPSDIALSHVAPGRPPGEQIGIVRVELAANVHKMLPEQGLKQGALLLPLANDAGLAFSGMHVKISAGDVHITA